MSDFETELDVTAGTFLAQIDVLGDLTATEFHFDVIQEYEVDRHGDEESAQVKITAIMLGGFGSKTDIFMDLNEAQQQLYESEIEAAMNDESREYYSADNQSHLMADDTAECTQHMDNMRMAT